MAKKRKAFSYLRVSGKAQAASGKDGFPRQRSAVEQYAKSNRVEIVAEYRDEGVSGAKELADRKGLAALLDRIESNGVELVLVERADRLARDLMVSEVILGQFRDLGVAVITADSGTDLTAGDGDPTRQLIRQVLGAVAQFEKNVIVMKLKAARDRKRERTGRCEGRKPYGSRPGEQEVMKRMKELHRKPHRRARRSYGAIAKILNDEGHKPRKGKKWYPMTVRNILLRHKR